MILNGNQLLLFLDGQVIGCTDNCEFSSTNETIDATCKDNNGARQVLSGSNSWTVTFSGLWDFASALGPRQLAAIHKNKTRVGIKMAVTDAAGTELAGGDYIIGYALLNQLTITGPLNAAATFSGTLEGDGEWSIDQTT